MAGVRARQGAAGTRAPSGARHVMDATARFVAAVQRPEAEVPLDEVCFLVGAHAHAGLDVPGELARLDDISAGCGDTVEGVVQCLFVDLGFEGNHDGYYDPRNSYLNEVLDRRLGIPITLSILMMEVGRRVGVELLGVSMPGHFVLRSGAGLVFVDPFAGGEQLDRDGVAARFRLLHGGDAPWDDGFLAPVGAHAIVARLLANLKAIFRAERDRANLLWVLRLRSAVPGVGLDERRELASVLAADGKFDEAARELESAAELAQEAQATEFRAAAVRLQARLN